MMLVNYASFIALQPDHFDLHSAVEEVGIEFTGQIKISVFLNKTKEELNKAPLRERGQETESIWERLVGNREKNKSSYFFREIKNGERYLIGLLQGKPQIFIYPKTGPPEEAVF